MVVDSDLSNYLDLVESNMHALAFVTSLINDRQSGQFVTTIFIHPIAFFCYFFRTFRVAFVFCANFRLWFPSINIIKVLQAIN